MDKNKLKNIAITSATTTASIAAMSSVLNPAVAIASATSLISHEFGHYYSALLHKAEPSLPIVLPLGFASIGITSISKSVALSTRARRYIIQAGPVAGLVAAFSLIPYAVMTASISMAVLFMVIAGEIYSWTFGSDGAKLKQLESMKNDKA